MSRGTSHFTRWDVRATNFARHSDWEWIRRSDLADAFFKDYGRTFSRREDRQRLVAHVQWALDAIAWGRDKSSHGFAEDEHQALAHLGGLLQWPNPGAEGDGMDKASEAVEMFRDGCACSQAILVAYGCPLGLAREQALQVSSGFAGGMRMGDTCGAVTGAFMVLGLLHGGSDSATGAGRAEVYAKVLDFADRFGERNGTLACRDLLGCDLRTPEGLAQAREQNLFKTVCVKMVRDAAEILEEMGGQ